MLAASELTQPTQELPPNFLDTLSDKDIQRALIVTEYFKASLELKNEQALVGKLHPDDEAYQLEQPILIRLQKELSEIEKPDPDDELTQQIYQLATTKAKQMNTTDNPEATPDQLTWSALDDINHEISIRLDEEGLSPPKSYKSPPAPTSNSSTKITLEISGL